MVTARPRGAEPAPSVKSAASPPVLEAGTVLGKCLLTECVGQGGTGSVFRALHLSLNVPVALKVLRLDTVRNDPALYAQLRSEARLLAQLNHPNIVRVLDFEDSADCPYLVLEYVEGLSLGELISQSGRVRCDRAVRIVSQVASGLAAAWRLGVVHRDVKPGNILLAKDGTAKLADLGLAVVLPRRGKEQTHTALADGMAGTIAYMSPEQALSAAAVDQRSDIYALGATFYHALTGGVPFKAKTRLDVMIKHAKEAPAPPHELVPGVDPAASAVVLRMMAKDPNQRYQDYGELLADLDRLRVQTEEACGNSSSTHVALRASTQPQAGSRPSLWRSFVRRWRP
jgi:serine/threonine protein kinase